MHTAEKQQQSNQVCITNHNAMDQNENSQCQMGIMEWTTKSCEKGLCQKEMMQRKTNQANSEETNKCIPKEPVPIGHNVMNKKIHTKRALPIEA